MNLGRALKRVPRFTYLLVLLGDILYLPIFVCTAPLGWGHCRGGVAKGGGARMHKYIVFYEKLCINMDTICMNICKHLQIYVNIHKYM